MTGTFSRKQQTARPKPAESFMRSYQLTEKKYQDTLASARAMFGVGIVLLYAGMIQLWKFIERRQLFPGGIFSLVSLLICFFLFLAGSRSLKQSQELKQLAESERHLANELVEWFITTYSSEQIDHQIDAITALSTSPEILCLQRLDMIHILLEREYDSSFKEEFLNQVCEDLYNMIFEKETALS